METTSLYVHIPFCIDICSYCDFCKVYYKEKLVDDYLEQLEIEANQLKIAKPLKTIYIGGGTPSALSLKQLEKLLEILKKFVTNELLEYSIELNIESTNQEKLKLLKKYQLNRLSIGVQTFNQEIMKKLNRHHQNIDINKIIQDAKVIGFDNISIDLIYGHRDQTIDQLNEDLKKINELQIQHISCYSLILEEHTKLWIDNYQPIEEQIEGDMADCISKTLQSYGFDQYEISNYAKKGFESKHNQVYWKYQNYYSLGAGATSKIDDTIYNASKNVFGYAKGKFTKNIEVKEKKDIMFEHIMMSLRLVQGLDILDFNQRYDVDFIEIYKDTIKKYQDKSILVIENNYIFVAKKYLNYLHTILLDFMDE